MSEEDRLFGKEKENNLVQIDQPYDRVNLWIGLGVLLFTSIIYLMTVQRTFSFWDCGEFVACSYILGVPHPPGTPLFVVIGRLFSLLPVAEDIGFRVNLLSALSTSFASMFGYFIVVRLIRDWFDGDADLPRRVGMYAAGVIGSLLMAFSLTNWSSAVEAEVYGLSMLLITLLIWLSLRWAECRGTRQAQKYLILIFFLGVLSTAIHLTVYLVMPMIMLMMLLLDEGLRKNPFFWISCAVLLVPVMSLWKFIWIGAVWTAILVVAYLVSNKRANLIVPFFMMIASATAFTAQLYIPIRAAERPAINENAPTSLDKFDDFLERRQYGQTSMVERMFTRRGQLANQFGRHPRMGFWSFFEEQYGISGTIFILTLFPLGLLGMVESSWRKWKKGVPFFLMVLAATVGLVLYMNFADGTMQGLIPNDDCHLEVRDRDYFFQPGFILFGLAIGLGVMALWDMVYKFLQNGGGRRTMVYGLLVFLVLPVFALKANYYKADRSNNYIPWDYAYNLLVSADSNAVVFTNGDNDTFPVWCLQEVYGVRTDVRIANLSLLNTDWYIKQLKNEMGVPISLSDAQIEALRHQRLPDGSIIRIQDMMIDNIIETNAWKVPIEFAVTVSEDNRRYRGSSIEDHLEMSGMMMRLKKDRGNELIDVDATYNFYMNEFRYRGVADDAVYKDENAARLTQNYAAGFIYTADVLHRQGDDERAIELAKKSIEVVPSEWRNYALLMQIYADMDSLHLAEEVLEAAPVEIDKGRLWLTLASDLRRKGHKDDSYRVLQKQLDKDPNYEDAFRQLLSYLYQDSAFDSIETVLGNWIENNPEDTDAIAAFGELKNLRGLDTTSGSVKVRQMDLPGDTN